VVLVPSDIGAVSTTAVGAASGVATLDGSTLVPTAQIPSLDASKITTGTFNAARIPNLDGGIITTGTLAYARHPVGTTANTLAAGNDSRFNPAEYLPADHGFQAWAYDPARCSSTNTLVTAGVLNMVRVKLANAGTLSKFYLYVAAAGANIANCFVGLYDSSGVRQATTADQSSNWTSTGVKSISFSVNYAAAAGFYWLGILVGTATTAPAFARATPTSSTGLVNANLGVSSARFATIGTGQTALPSSITPGSLVLSDVAYWGAVG